MKHVEEAANRCHMNGDAEKVADVTLIMKANERVSGVKGGVKGTACAS